MKITRLSCQGCGAPLEASASVVTCRFCRTQTEIVPDHIQTRAIEILSAQNRRLEMEVAEQHLREDLRRIDEAWAVFRGRYLISDGSGDWMDPFVFRTGSGLFAVVLGLVFTWRAAVQESLLWLPAMLMTLIGARIVASGWLRHLEFERAQKSYLDRRAELVAGIREASRIRRTAV